MRKVEKDYGQRLTDDQRRVLVDGATEAPFSGKYVHFDGDGMYLCAACNSPLFSSETKFDSGSGWPSFFDVVGPEAVRLVEDTSHGMQRVEVRCSVCDGHLGHVFNDAPSEPTGMRFCINSASLEFSDKKGTSRS